MEAVQERERGKNKRGREKGKEGGREKQGERRSGEWGIDIQNKSELIF